MSEGNSYQGYILQHTLSMQVYRRQICEGDLSCHFDYLRAATHTSTVMLSRIYSLPLLHCWNQSIVSIVTLEAEFVRHLHGKLKSLYQIHCIWAASVLKLKLQIQILPEYWELKNFILVNGLGMQSQLMSCR